MTSVFVCYFLFNYQITFNSELIVTAVALFISFHYFSYKYKLYKKVWEYASIRELIMILQIVSLSIVITISAELIVLQTIQPRLYIVKWLLLILFIGGSRFWWRVARDLYMKKTENKKRALIIGAGSAGTMVARQLQKSNQSNLLPIAFVDDNVRMHSLDILGIPVIGGSNQIVRIVQELNIENVVIAIPSLSKKDLNRIFRECAKTKAKTQILPMLEDLVSGKVTVNQFRDVLVEDLLGREQVELDMDSISNSVTNKVVLVTGAGGSIGSEICRQVVNFNPETLILLGHGENSIYAIEMELRHLCKKNDIRLVTEIADIQDKPKISILMETYKPDVVYHAAAHKHVPLMERNPEEAVKNNMIGTFNVAIAANNNGVKTFVMISSDKAVNPTSVMGATKRLAEMIIQDMDKKSQTKFVTVRFGNVLGSRGSVIPLFKKQIQKGGPVTVTHPDMQRYFMTIPEASRLVIQAGSLARGGETFVLDMGSPVKIVDLARNLIKLSGFTEDEIGIEFTSIRPGEKLFEELLNENEIYEQQIHPKIYIGKTSDLFMDEIEDILLTYMNLQQEELSSLLVSLANRKRIKEKAVSRLVR
nr:nucleoside-diphosphate sugar epimerase/dehydratase [Bacillus sp. FJAT-29790]